MKALKWIGIVLGVLVGLVVIVVAVLFFIGRSRLAAAPDVPVQMVTIPTDDAALARGEHLAQAVSACIGCHGENLEGAVFLDEAPVGYVPAPNLTAGAGGVGGELSDEAWVRALRHGVGHDGRTLVLMPSQAYAHLSDEDLGALIAYAKTVPPVDNELEPRRFDFLGTILLGVMGYGDNPVALIEHEAVGGSAPAEGVTVEYGEYLSQIAVCRDCHGANLAGRTEETGPPPGPNLTPGGELSAWSEEDFITLMRTGVTPAGEEISEEMPWIEYRLMTDEELSALWMYLQTLPARELGDNE